MDGCNYKDIVELKGQARTEVIAMQAFVTDDCGCTGQVTITAPRSGGHEVTALVRSEQAAQAKAR